MANSRHWSCVWTKFWLQNFTVVSIQGIKLLKILQSFWILYSYSRRICIPLYFSKIGAKALKLSIMGGSTWILYNFIITRALGCNKRDITKLRGNLASLHTYIWKFPTTKNIIDLNLIRPTWSVQSYNHALQCVPCGLDVACNYLNAMGLEVKTWNIHTYLGAPLHLRAW